MIPHKKKLMLYYTIKHIVQIVCMTKHNKSDVLLGGRTSGLDGTNCEKLDESGLVSCSHLFLEACFAESRSPTTMFS